MSVFTEAEREYLGSATLGRLATIGPDGQPHVVPVTYAYNAAEDTIDVGGITFGQTKKWRDAQRNPRVTFLVDESWGKGAKAIEIRGHAEAHETGGDKIHPGSPTSSPSSCASGRAGSSPGASSRATARAPSRSTPATSDSGGPAPGQPLT